MKKKFVVVSVIIISLFILFRVYALRAENPEEYISDENIETSQSLRATGTVKPAKTISIRANLAGEVEEINLKEGDLVEEGDLLLTYDSSLVELDLKRSYATLEEFKGQLLESQLAIQEAQIAIDLARKRLDRAKVVKDKSLKEDINIIDLEIDYEEKELSRFEKLFDNNVIEKVKLEGQEYKVDILKARRKRGLAQLDEIHQSSDINVGEAEIQVKIAKKLYETLKQRDYTLRKRLDIFKADYDKAKLKVDNYTLYSPIDGRVVSKSVEAGEYIQQGSQIIRISSEKLLIRIRPDERELGLLEVGQEGIAFPRAYPEEEFKVIVTRIAPEVDSNRGTIDLYLEPIEDNYSLLPNMSVFVELSSLD